MTLMQTSAKSVCPIDLQQLTSAAATALINRRVASAYLHDFRGSLQALQGAMELLARVAKTGVSESERLDKATALAKRTVMNHQHVMHEMLARLTGDSLSDAGIDTPARTYGQMIQEALFLLRHHAERKGVRFVFVGSVDTAAPGSEPEKTFIVLVGLLLTALDGAEEDEELPVRLTEESGTAVMTIALGSNAAFRSLPGGEIRSEADLILRHAQSFFDSVAGSLALDASNDRMPVVRARHPA